MEGLAHMGTTLQLKRLSLIARRWRKDLALNTNESRAGESYQSVRRGGKSRTSIAAKTRRRSKQKRTKRNKNKGGQEALRKIEHLARRWLRP